MVDRYQWSIVSDWHFSGLLGVKLRAVSAVSENRPQTGAARLKITDWVVRAAVAFIFVSSGLEKFSIGSGAEWIKIFARIGWGDWFRYLTGGLEIAGGILLMVPFTSTLGAALLVACMVGAIAAHIFKLGDPFSSIINILLIVAILFAARKPRSEADEMTSLALATHHGEHEEHGAI